MFPRILAVCGRTLFCDYFICVIIPISLSHFFNPFSFFMGLLLQQVLFHIAFNSRGRSWGMFYLFRFFCINSAITLACKVYCLEAIPFIQYWEDIYPSLMSFMVSWTEKSHTNLSFCCQLMPLAYAHWFSIFSANLWIFALY